MTVSVVSVDPAPSKPATVYDGRVLDSANPFSEKKAAKLRKLLCGLTEAGPDTLICWDAPLTGPRDPDHAGETDKDFSQRHVESFFARKETGFKAPKGISVLPYSSCPHWAITRSLLGLPRTGPHDTGYADLPFRLLPGADQEEDLRPCVAEIHPALGAWLWCRGGEGFPEDSEPWPYKTCTDLRRRMWRLIRRKTRAVTCQEPRDDDDDFDAAVGYLLGALYLRDRAKPTSRRSVVLLGNRKTGSFLVPRVTGLLKSWHNFAK